MLMNSHPSCPHDGKCCHREDSLFLLRVIEQETGSVCFRRSFVAAPSEYRDVVREAEAEVLKSGNSGLLIVECLEIPAVSSLDKVMNALEGAFDV